MMHMSDILYCIPTAVALLRLVSPGAVTDGVTLFIIKKVMTFLVVVTTPTLSTFPPDRWS